MKTHQKIQELESIEKRLVLLEKEKNNLLEKKRLLLDKASVKETIIDNGNLNHKLSTEQKVNLFAQLFQGRKDIYATRWENKQGRSGYSVACANEWKPVICKKPKVKCVDCHNRLFSPLDNKAIYDHLSGKMSFWHGQLFSRN